MTKTVSNFAERLRQAMFDKRCKAVDVARDTKIGPSVISRYLSGMNQPSRDNLFALEKFLEVSPEWLLSSSVAPQSIQRDRDISDKDRIIEVQAELIENLQKQIKEWEEWKASSKARHAKGREKAKNPIKPNKQKVGFLKKHKYQK